MLPYAPHLHAGGLAGAAPGLALCGPDFRSRSVVFTLGEEQHYLLFVTLTLVRKFTTCCPRIHTGRVLDGSGGCLCPTVGCLCLTGGRLCPTVGCSVSYGWVLVSDCSVLVSYL